MMALSDQNLSIVYYPEIFGIKNAVFSGQMETTLRDGKLLQYLYQAVLQPDPFLLCLLAAVQYLDLTCTVCNKIGGRFFSGDSHEGTH